jgi:hypothetical protein
MDTIPAGQGGEGVAGAAEVGAERVVAGVVLGAAPGVVLGARGAGSAWRRVMGVPVRPRVEIRVRPGTLDDLPFIDDLQKKHSRELGFLPRMALVGKIELGQVLVAEATGGVVSDKWPVTSADGAGGADAPLVAPSAAEGAGAREQLATGHSSLATPPSLVTGHCQLTTPPTPVGYLIAADRYLKRDEMGYITQINVLPAYWRHLVGAKLLQAQFDRSASGCKLYSCWCAQDLTANAFWEAMGFTPIAFRMGAAKKRVASGGEWPVAGADGGEAVASEKWPVAGADGAGHGAGGSGSLSAAGAAGARVQLATGHSRTNHSSAPRIHIFWQKRIRANDTTTPWWYPSATQAGQMRADRLCFPIMPGVRWQDVRPIEAVCEAMRETDGEEARDEGGEARHEGGEARHEGTKAQRHEGADGAGASLGGHFVPSCLSASVPSSARAKRSKPAKKGFVPPYRVPAGDVCPEGWTLLPPWEGCMFWQVSEGLPGKVSYVKNAKGRQEKVVQYLFEPGLTFAEARAANDAARAEWERQQAEGKAELPVAIGHTSTSSVELWPVGEAEVDAEGEADVDVEEQTPKAKKSRGGARVSPRLAQLARELRDEWSERVAEVVPPVEPKHDVTRTALPGVSVEGEKKTLALPDVDGRAEAA